MKIIAFAGSNSKNSINKKLATHVAHLFENATVEVLDLNDFALPVFGVDLEAEMGPPQLAKDFLDKLASADIIVMSLAENNGSYSTAFKNIFDWSSRQYKDVFQQKPMLLMATSPGGRGGASVLELANGNLPRFGANIKAIFSLPSFNENFDVAQGKISNPELAHQIQELVRNFSWS
ncbi:NADPH-dependent oxidoreductase [Flavobacterium amnicola]|uniref:NADPH-dependent oxidoreductase n=1 Tax=Flavobacterium amnicola TaxID=2506422 RepID=A0A4Q1K0A9_9FLAO|nr:NAD(P)H-dependent oxidoreductase [Flavobacterium amnicola]RXR16297.1 NADPH-dependent oxidoreductase [Flavobacterium amnicola]